MKGERYRLEPETLCVIVSWMKQSIPQLSWNKQFHLLGIAHQMMWRVGKGECRCRIYQLLLENCVPAKIAVVGNCQASQVVKLLSASVSSLEFYDLPANYLATEDDRAQFDNAYKCADIVFAQFTPGNSVIECCTHKYAQEFSRKTIVWPNVYFDGYAPDICYYRAGGEIIYGPLGGYHSKFIREKFIEGRSWEEALDLYQGRSYATAYPNAFEMALSNLRLREESCDIKVSSQIDKFSRSSKVFYTPNHPSNKILSHMLCEFGDMIGISVDIKVELVSELGDLDIPASRHLLQREGCKFVDRESFLARNTSGEYVEYPCEHVVRDFYDFYSTMDLETLKSGVAL